MEAADIIAIACGVAVVIAFIVGRQLEKELPPELKWSPEDDVPALKAVEPTLVSQQDKIAA